MLQDQLEVAYSKVQLLLGHFEEARYLLTIPGMAWQTAAGLIAEIGPIDRFKSARQVVKLAGVNPSQCQTGLSRKPSTMSKRGRARLRSLLYMATLAGIQHNPRLRDHFERLIQREDRPLSRMAAVGACMNKLLTYAFVVMKKRVEFQVDHKWSPRADAVA